MIFQDMQTGKNYSEPDTIKSPCGELAHIQDAGYPAYRCESCSAIIGSIAMPNNCFNIMELARGKKK